MLSLLIQNGGLAVLYGQSGQDMRSNVFKPFGFNKDGKTVNKGEAFCCLVKTQLPSNYNHDSKSKVVC